MSPAKVIPPRGKSFFLKPDQAIEDVPEFSRLSTSLQKEIGWLGIFGKGYGFHIVSFGGRDSASIDVFKSKIIFSGSDETGWIGMRFERHPIAVIFQQDGTRIEPVTNKEMNAELAAGEKPSRKER